MADADSGIRRRPRVGNAPGPDGARFSPGRPAPAALNNGHEQ
ncbi:hypothetical protein T261_00151 [Streptomyces lydicus]|nr:hypothetical protein T261_00151 [Streptomyces lydicus]